jgi:hypothetical protein
MVGTASRAAQPRYHFKERTARSLMPLSEASPIPPILPWTGLFTYNDKKA